ncbi:MAG TPA: penicillin-binding transpeptidase domain-containing protein, partial [Planctomycetota bacterium]|nr:penicillin-binding transpeptidase domain-containing protein [Planctomycetota bacterium]
GPGGVAPLGFRLAPGFARDPAQEFPGASLALLLGVVTDEGVAASGAEARLDDVLRGTPGLAVASGATAVVKRAPRHGRDVALTLSAKLQDRLEKLAAPYPSPQGAAAVVDVATGGVLAAVTWPRPKADDVEDATHALLAAQSERIAAQRALNRGDASARARRDAAAEAIRRSPAVHRATEATGQTAPGSVFKALTLLQGLESGAIGPAYAVDCHVGKRSSFGCKTHGDAIGLREALERSCNTYCYDVGMKLGYAPMVELYDRLGLFDAVPGISRAGEMRGLRRALMEGCDDPRNLAIGQGSLNFSPVRVAGVAASLARGRVVRPHLAATDGFEPIGPAFAAEAHLRLVRDGMHDVVFGARGTARATRDLRALRVAGKTGTAQVTTSKPALHSAWFVGFAPYGDGATPKYAFAVLYDRTADEGADTAPFAAGLVRACYDLLGGGP